MRKSFALLAAVACAAAPALALSESCGLSAGPGLPTGVSFTTVKSSTQLVVLGTGSNATATVTFTPCGATSPKTGQCYDGSLIALSNATTCLFSREQFEWSSQADGSVLLSAAGASVSLVCDTAAQFAGFTVRTIAFTPSPPPETLQFKATFGIRALCGTPGFPLFTATTTGGVRTGQSQDVYSSGNNLFFPQQAFGSFATPLSALYSNAEVVPTVATAVTNGKFLVSVQSGAVPQRRLMIATVPTVGEVTFAPVQGAPTEAICSTPTVVAATTPTAAGSMEVTFTAAASGLVLGGVTLKNKLLTVDCSGTSFVFLTSDANNNVIATVVEADAGDVPRVRGAVPFAGGSGFLNPTVTVGATGEFGTVVAGGVLYLVNLRSGRFTHIATATAATANTATRFSGGKMLVVPRPNTITIYNLTATPTALETQVFARSDIVGSLTVRPSLTSGFVVSSPVTGATYGFDNNGAHAWTVRPGMPSTIGLSNSGKTVVIATPGVGVSAYSTATGRQLWSTIGLGVPTTVQNPAEAVSVVVVGEDKCIVQIGKTFYGFGMAP